MPRLSKPLTCVVAVAALALSATPALAWGPKGHEAIALIAQHYLNDQATLEVNDLLKGAIDGNDATITQAATWADAFRPTKEGAYTAQWHFIDLDFDKPDLLANCSKVPPPPYEPVAWKGTGDNCVINKITQFKAELADHSLPREQRQKALLFLLHFVGDIHQPLHDAERDNDRGGNLFYIVFGSNQNGDKLHRFWDGSAVAGIGSTSESIANLVIADFDKDQHPKWRSEKDLSVWAMDGYKIALQYAYGPALKSPTMRTCVITEFDKPSHEEQCHVLDAKGTYRHDATGQAFRQIERAGVRLADILNETVGKKPKP